MNVPLLNCSPVENERTAEAADYLWRQWPHRARAGIILGTGLGNLTASIAPDVAFAYQDIPHFPRSTALSHAGRLLCGKLAGVPVMALDGRWHLYEGYRADDITLPIFAMQKFGVELLIVSNASGGLNPRFRSGDIMLIADHINLMGRQTAALSSSNSNPSRSGGCSPYDPGLLDFAQQITRREGFTCHRGTYVAVLGPNYETRAEYRAMRRIGGDAVGMSTVPEVLAAMRCGMRVLALSTITNIASPDQLTATNAQTVVDIASMAEPKLRHIVLGVLQREFSDPDARSEPK